jgi:hypothetical protein
MRLYCHFVSVGDSRVFVFLAGATLLEIKKSFRNGGGNALQDWSGEAASPSYCSWRGVLCDNVTFAVAAL